MSRKRSLRGKIEALFNGSSPRRRKQMLAAIAFAFGVAALLETVAPEWATVFFDLFSILVSVF